jgi:hypothetical protein
MLLTCHGSRVRCGRVDDAADLTFRGPLSLSPGREVIVPPFRPTRARSPLAFCDRRSGGAEPSATRALASSALFALWPVSTCSTMRSPAPFMYSTGASGGCAPETCELRRFEPAPPAACRGPRRDALWRLSYDGISTRRRQHQLSARA